MFARRDKAAPAAAYIEGHQEMEVRVGEARESERSEAGLVDRDPKFLMEFTDETLLWPFMLLDLAARKFPKAAERFSLRALRDQHPAIGVDESNGGNEHELHER